MYGLARLPGDTEPQLVAATSTAQSSWQGRGHHPLLSFLGGSSGCKLPTYCHAMQERRGAWERLSTRQCMLNVSLVTALLLKNLSEPRGAVSLPKSFCRVRRIPHLLQGLASTTLISQGQIGNPVPCTAKLHEGEKSVDLLLQVGCA